MDFQARLGRVIQHDPRSRQFAQIPRTYTLRNRVWRRYGKILDQGDYGSCVGFATAHLINMKPAHTKGEYVLKYQDAFDLYVRATELDPFPGQMPEVDTGSSGLAGIKAAHEAKLISEYRWIFNFDDFLGTLANEGPVSVGSWWYTSMFSPNRFGHVTVDGGRAGGHQWVAQGMIPKLKLIVGQNSWVPWGIRGRFFISFDDMKRLLDEEGDAHVAR